MLSFSPVGRGSSHVQVQRLRYRKLRLVFRHLHVEGREQHCGTGVSAHEHDELNELRRLEQSLHPGKRRRRDFVIADSTWRPSSMIAA